MAAATESSQQLSDALIAFSLEGRFPEDISHLPPVSETNLQPAIQALAKAKKALEVPWLHPGKLPDNPKYSQLR